MHRYSTRPPHALEPLDVEYLGTETIYDLKGCISQKKSTCSELVLDHRVAEPPAWYSASNPAIHCDGCFREIHLRQTRRVLPPKSPPCELRLCPNCFRKWLNTHLDPRLWSHPS